MNNEFIAKFRTKNYVIGSFDAYLDMSKDLTKKNLAISDRKVNEIINNMPTQYRAAIQDRNDNYIGYIGIYNISVKEGIASLMFVTNKRLTKKDRNSIISIYKKWLRQNISINEIEKLDYITPFKTKTVIIRSNINIYRELKRSDFLIHEIPQEVLDKFSNIYDVPNMELSCQIISNNKVLGIIGLNKVIWSNKRGSLNIFLDRKYAEENKNEIIIAINDYLNYVHNKRINNVNLEVDGSDEIMLEIIRNTNMNYYAVKPYSKVNKDKIGSLMLFQHIPYMTKKRKERLPKNNVRNVSDFDTSKKELDKIVIVDKDYKMVSPSVFEENDIDYNKILDSYIKSMQVRSRFTIPLGEDKYMLQKGNENYGLYKKLRNFTYIVLDKNNNYIGFVSMLVNNYKDRNAEVEIGITPKMQRQGIGTKVLKKFQDELFSVGYASITSTIFNFNKASTKIHKKSTSIYCGTRKNSYYVNGKYWDMNIYTKVNNLVKK